jgi:hypothetical protein
MNADRQRLTAARSLRVCGILLWIAAGIHLAALPLLSGTVASRMTADAFAFVWPPFAFSYVLDAILLVPLGFTAFYCAGGVLQGERWGTILGLSSALVVLAIPGVIVLMMGFRYFSSLPFLVATLVVLTAGLLMTAALLRLARHAAV